MAERGSAADDRGRRRRRLEVALLSLLVLLMPVSRIFEAGGKLVNLSLADPILLAGAAYLAWRMISGGIRLPLAALFCLNVATLFLASFLNLEVSLATRGPAGVVVECLKILFLWLYFYAVVNWAESREDLLLFIKCWVRASVVVALLGIGGSILYQAAGIDTPFALMYRAQGTFEDANLYATHLSLGLFLLLLKRRLCGSRLPADFGAGAALLAGLAFSASRGSLMALAGGLLVLWLLQSSLRAKLGSLAGGVAAVLVLLVMPGGRALLERNPVTQRLATATVDLSNPEAAQRRQMWEKALETFQRSPLVGVGRGNYGQDGIRGDSLGSYAHNTYLGLLAEVGMLGALPYALLLLRSVWIPARARRRAETGQMRAAWAVLLGALTTAALNAVTINLENYRGAWMLLGAVECARRLYAAEEGAAAAETAGRGAEAERLGPGVQVCRGEA